LLLVDERELVAVLVVEEPQLALVEVLRVLELGDEADVVLAELPAPVQRLLPDLGGLGVLRVRAAVAVPASDVLLERLEGLLALVGRGVGGVGGKAESEGGGGEESAGHRSGS